jgi:pyoverdine/dityrosine biosynthesis protein Dit1
VAEDQVVVDAQEEDDQAEVVKRDLAAVAVQVVVRGSIYCNLLKIIIDHNLY